MYLAEPVGNMFFRGCPDIPAFDKGRPAALACNGAKAGTGQAGVQPENNHASDLEYMSDITLLMASALKIESRKLLFPRLFKKYFFYHEAQYVAQGNMRFLYSWSVV